MEDQLSDYRNIHKQKYMEIERQRLEEERKRHEEKSARLEEERQRKVKEDEALALIDTYCGLLKEINNHKEMIKILEKVTSGIEGLPVEKLNTKGYDLLDIVNGNKNISINIANERDRGNSERIKGLVKDILCKCGIEADDMDMEYDMDCSRDEEIARSLQEQLARSFITEPTPVPLNTAPKKKRGRPPKNTATTTN